MVQHPKTTAPDQSETTEAETKRSYPEDKPNKTVDVDELYKCKKEGSRCGRESQIWLVLKWPLMLAFVAVLPLQFLLMYSLTGSVIGIIALLVIETAVCIHFYRKKIRGTAADEVEKAIREMAKKKQI